MTTPSPLDEWIKGRAATDYEAARMYEAVYWLLGELRKATCPGDLACETAADLLSYANYLCGEGEEPQGLKE